MKKTILSIAFTLLSIGVFAQFDGSVGTNGCKAISINSPSIKAWALGVQVNRGKQTDDTSLYASYGSNDWAIGKPDSTTTRAVSLGEGGSCIITFDRPIFNGAGYDFMITENSFGVMTNSQSNSEFLELAFVEVSSDGINYFRFPSISNNTTTDCKSSLINNLAGKYSVGWGCGFNLDDIPNNVLLDKNNIRFIRLVDVRNGQDTDSRGNIIYEAPGSFGYSSGFDLTGVGIINGKTPYIVSSMDSLLTNNNSYEIVSTSNSVMGADSMYRKDFVSNGLAFQGLGYYSYGYFMSIGFASSNMTAVDSSNTLSSSYVSASKGGLNGSGDGYINAYYSDYGDIEHCVIKRDDSSMFYPQGVYVNTSLSMYNYLTSSAFPSNGWETLTAIGYDANGNKTDSTTIYLADTNGNKINSWTYMDLSKLSLCKKIIMKLNGNDKSYGYLNVPSYFCLDGFTYSTSNTIITTPIVATMDSLLTSNNTFTLTDTSNGVICSDGNYRKAFISNGLNFEGLGYDVYGYIMSIGFGPSNLTNAIQGNLMSSYYVSSSNGGYSGNNNTYMVGYYSDYGGPEHCVIKRDDSSMFYPQGVYVNTSLSMYNHFTSSSFPANGWETLTAIGYDENGNKTDSTTIYLADANGNKIHTWTYMDLSNLSLCKKIVMKLDGNDKSGAYLNPPSYFCLDNFSYSTSNATTTTPTLSLPRTISVAIDSIDSDAIVHYSTLAGDSTTVVSSNYQFLDYATKTITSSILANTLYIARVIAIDSKGDTFYSPEVLFEKVDVSGLDNLDISSMISLYPNPTNATSNLVLSLNDNAQVNIFDIQGRCLQTMRLDKSSTTPINLQGRKGVFYIRIISANQTTTKKLIIQ